MSLEQRMYKKLIAEIQPERLIVTNESHLHRGHAGDDGSGESHFKVEMVAESLKDLSYVQRERAVHQALTEEMKAIHALSIKFIKE